MDAFLLKNSTISICRENYLQSIITLSNVGDAYYSSGWQYKNGVGGTLYRYRSNMVYAA